MRLSETPRFCPNQYVVADYDERFNTQLETGGSYEVTSQAITGQGRNDSAVLCYAWLQPLMSWSWSSQPNALCLIQKSNGAKAKWFDIHYTSSFYVGWWTKDKRRYACLIERKLSPRVTIAHFSSSCKGMFETPEEVTSENFQEVKKLRQRSPDLTIHYVSRSIYHDVPEN